MIDSYGFFLRTNFIRLEPNMLCTPLPGPAPARAGPTSWLGWPPLGRVQSGVPSIGQLRVTVLCGFWISVIEAPRVAEGAGTMRSGGLSLRHHGAFIVICGACSFSYGRGGGRARETIG